MKAILIPLACMVATCQALAADPREVRSSAAVIPFAEQFVLHSKHSNRDFLIQVSFPTQSQSDGKAAALYVLDGKAAALYVLDGNGGFALFTDSVRLLHPGAIGTTYVVAIGYVNVVDSGDLRDIDLAHVKGVVRGFKLGGGGAAFERFILEELRPLIEARYPVDPDKAVLLGHSLGGLFATTVLANKPDAFAGYLISSPSLQFDPSLLARVRTASRVGARSRVYLSIGSGEGRVAVSAAEALHAALTSADSAIETRYCNVPGYYHMSVTLTLASVALPYLIPPERAPEVTRRCPSSVIESRTRPLDAAK